MIVFDKESALNNVIGSEEMLSELINTFVSHNIDSQSMQILCDSVRGKDLAAIFRRTHNLKSTSLYVGAGRLSQVVIELLECSREMISSVIKASYNKINEQWDENITQQELDNASAIIDLKKTIEPVLGILEKNDQDLFNKFTFHIASELLRLSDSKAFASIITMTEKILIEAKAYKEAVSHLLIEHN